MPFTFTFGLSQNQTFELRCDYGTRRLETHELANLIDLCEKNYYSQDNDDIRQLQEIGHKLYSWLDGKEGWLRRALEENTEKRIYLDLIKTSETQSLNTDTQRVALGLAHLPWELLHNNQGFLLNILPVRKVKQNNSNALAVQNRPLRLLFMATSPEHPGISTLQFEREETNILQATREQPLALVVEESGCVAELGNLVSSYDDDYFDVFHLTGHAVIYTETAFSSLLPAGKKIKDYTPCFITEDELGNVEFTTVEDLAKAFKKGFPQVVFLSGCHTGQNANQGTVPSMAQALVKAGAAVVLGWARPVFDRTGIIAAQALYQALATGQTVEDAVKIAQQEMITQKCSDWHLLRIYRDTRPIAELVTPLNTRKREKLKFSPPENEFLDENNIVKVASQGEFVGRRRALQRGLKALRQTSDKIGMFIAGMGGLGKSSLAARLCTRVQLQRDNFQRVVLIGPVDEIGFIGKLASKYERFAGVPALLNEPGISLTGRLQNFFEKIEDELDKPLLLVLDDFEQNIPTANIEDGSLRMTTDAYQVLAAVCAALAENQAESRLIVTCRYLKEETLPPHRLHLESLGGMGDGDIDKIYRSWKQDVQQTARKQRILKIADGNPRLLKWLVEVLQQPGLVAEELLTKLEDVQLKFRENILAETLLKGLEEEEKKFLARLSVFRLPVRKEIIEDLSPNLSPGRKEALNSPHSLAGKGVGGLGFLPKLMSLSLVESATVYAGKSAEYRVTTILEPLLQPLLTEAEWQTTYQTATRKTYQAWWEEMDNRNEEQTREIVRLAVLAQEKDLAVTVGNSIARHWVNSSRYLEAMELCQNILQLGEDYRILGTIARAEETLGLAKEAFSHLQQALTLCPEDDLIRKASIFHNMAGLKATQGDIDGAFALNQQSWDINDSINNDKGKAANLQQMARLKATQGDIAEAFFLCQQSLDINDSITDVEKAAILNQMAGLKARQGDIAEAITFYQQSWEITDSTNYVQGKAVALANMAYWTGERGNKTQQIELNLQAAQLLAQVRAYVDLFTILCNLSIADTTKGIIYLAQAVWLCLRIQVPLHDTVNTLSVFYYTLPQVDEMAALLGVTAVYLCQVRGERHPQLEELQQRSFKILSNAAVAQGIETQEAFDSWFVQQRLNDSEYFIPRLRERLEAIIGDEWVFNPGDV